MRLATIVVLLSVCLVAANAQDDAAKKELAKFQGTWALTDVEKDGRQAGAEQFADYKLIVEGNKRILKKGDQVVGESTFKLDPTKSPKVMFITMTVGALKDKTLPAIYEFDGDSQRVCVALNGISPPMDFTTEAGNGHILQVFTKGASCVAGPAGGAGAGPRGDGMTRRGRGEAGHAMRTGDGTRG